EKPMARGIPLVIIGSIGRIHLGAGANDCLGFQGAEALRHRWNWNKWGRNKSLDNDTLASEGVQDFGHDAFSKEKRPP
ncbi:MAG: hypothetical protein K6F32_02840, partial [Bacilli bacterium]|nr:hypothetical protein [Bacilli bacterium]